MESSIRPLPKVKIRVKLTSFKTHMTPDLFKLLLPRINAKVLEIMHRHLSDEQIGLLLVKLVNPYAVLSQQEEAVLRGVDRKTLRGMKERGELPRTLSEVKGKDSPSSPNSSRNLPHSPHRGKPSAKRG